VDQQSKGREKVQGKAQAPSYFSHSPIEESDAIKVRIQVVPFAQEYVFL